MIGNVDGLTLPDGYNPFRAGVIAQKFPDLINRLVLAKTQADWAAISRGAFDEESRWLQELWADRPEFARHALAAGVSYTDADKVYGRLMQAVHDARAQRDNLRFWFIDRHRPEILAENGYFPSGPKALEEGWVRKWTEPYDLQTANALLHPLDDAWALSWQVNRKFQSAALLPVLSAVNELDELARFIMGPPPRMRFDDATGTIWVDGSEIARNQDRDVIAYFRQLFSAYPNPVTFEKMKAADPELTNHSRTKSKMPNSLKCIFISIPNKGSKLILPPLPAP